MIVAVVNNSVVTAVQTITDPNVDGGAAYAALAQGAQAAIDITTISPQPQVGWTFDGANLNPVSGAVNWKITKLAMRERFIITELMGVEAASIGSTSEALAIQAIMGNLQVATYVDLSRPDTITAIDTLVAYGLLTSGRATAILTTPPTATELYQG